MYLDAAIIDQRVDQRQLGRAGIAEEVAHAGIGQHRQQCLRTVKLHGRQCTRAEKGESTGGRALLRDCETASGAPSGAGWITQDTPGSGIKTGTAALVGAAVPFPLPPRYVSYLPVLVEGRLTVLAG